MVLRERVCVSRVMRTAVRWTLSPVLMDPASDLPCRRNRSGRPPAHPPLPALDAGQNSGCRSVPALWQYARDMVHEACPGSPWTVGLRSQGETPWWCDGPGRHLGVKQLQEAAVRAGRGSCNARRRGRGMPARPGAGPDAWGSQKRGQVG